MMEMEMEMEMETGPETETQMFVYCPLVAYEECEEQENEHDHRAYGLYRAWITVVQMLSDRHYAINEKIFDDISFEQFKKRAYGSVDPTDRKPNYKDMTIQCPHPEYPQSKVLVMFVGSEERLTAKDIISYLHLQKVLHFILVQDDQITSETMGIDVKEIDGIFRKKSHENADAQPKLDFETFGVLELYYNKARYSSGICKRRYELVTPAEKKQLLKDLKILLGGEGDDSKKELITKRFKVKYTEPEIFFTRYFALKREDVIKCTLDRPLVNSWVVADFRMVYYFIATGL